MRSVALLALWVLALLWAYVRSLSCSSDSILAPDIAQTASKAYIVQSDGQRWGALRSTPCDGLQLPPAARWTPLQALRHPFITGEPFAGSFSPFDTPIDDVAAPPTGRVADTRLAVPSMGEYAAAIRCHLAHRPVVDSRWVRLAQANRHTMHSVDLARIVQTSDRRPTRP